MDESQLGDLQDYTKVKNSKGQVTGNNSMSYSKSDFGTGRGNLKKTRETNNSRQGYGNKSPYGMTGTGGEVFDYSLTGNGEDNFMDD
jgi:hypothetical protein